MNLEQKILFEERLEFYLEHGYWPGEAPREPDDLKDCYRNVEEWRKGRRAVQLAGLKAGT